MSPEAPQGIDWSASLPRVVHGTCVALDGSALLLIGPSGSGKSSVALQLLALGAGLVSDDLTRLERHGTRIIASCPAAPDAPFAIEARGLGVLRAVPAGPAALRAVVDLSRTEPMRLPPPRQLDLEGCRVRLLARADTPAFPAMLLHLLRHGFYPS